VQVICRALNKCNISLSDLEATVSDRSKWKDVWMHVNISRIKRLKTDVPAGIMLVGLIFGATLCKSL